MLLEFPHSCGWSFFWWYSNRFANEIKILLVKNKKHFFSFQAKSPHIDGWISYDIFPLKIHYSRYSNDISNIYIYIAMIYTYIIFMYTYTKIYIYMCIYIHPYIDDGSICHKHVRVASISNTNPSSWGQLGTSGWMPIIYGMPTNQWEFQDPKMEVPTIYKAYFSGLCKWISPQNITLYGTNVFPSVGSWNTHWTNTIINTITNVGFQWFKPVW